MLVLSRKQGESIRIGKNVWVTVVDIGKKAVRLAFDAPADVEILRSELEEQREKCAAADAA